MAATPTKTKEKSTGLIAVVRIRGKVGVNERILRTLKMLNLHKKNWCVVVPNTPSVQGMIIKAKDYCTFGEVDNKTVAELLEKRGRITGNLPLTKAHLQKSVKVDFEGFAAKLAKGEAKLKDVPGTKPYFKLKPPVGGFERGGTRRSYSSGGALGYRGAEISKLITKML